jgi:hypothetical protein
MSDQLREAKQEAREHMNDLRSAIKAEEWWAAHAAAQVLSERLAEVASLEAQG